MRWRVAAAAMALVCATHAHAQATLRAVAFAGGWNLPIWAAQRQGYFEANGIALSLSYTPSSAALVTGVMDGRYDVALATIDNFIAYREGQGEAKLDGEPDFVAFLGGDPGFLSLVAAPSVSSVGELKGRTLSVDATTNGLAFVVRELLARGGLADGDVALVRAGGTDARYRALVAGQHDATLLRTPFELLARERGLRVLASAESLGPYQGTVAAARRAWLAAHEKEAVEFVRAYRAALGWLYDRANRPVVEALLVANIRDMTPSLATQAYDILLADKGGLARDGALDVDGIRTVLMLRSKYGVPKKALADPARYVDTTYYDKAAARP